ncbi:MAG TPA: carbohydrate binding domain-containing protein [Candidatus Thermoplasmatota archaeon]|nr:carbohydrate binding domain-containing protein [Candidatus Thermoplasmatota archaeon]
MLRSVVFVSTLVLLPALGAADSGEYAEPGGVPLGSDLGPSIAAAGPPLGVNLLSNAGFERDNDLDGIPDGWQHFGSTSAAAVRSPADLNEGRFSAQFTDVSTSAALGLMSEHVFVGPGWRFNASLWVKNAVGSVHLRVEMFDGAGNFHSVIFNDETGALDWEQLTVAVTVPSGVATARVAAYSATSSITAGFADEAALVVSYVPPPPACSDGLDNDGDGLVDSPADPGCASATDANESNPAACADGLDNDGDGLVDYPADPGCGSAADSDEYNAPPTPANLLVDAGFEARSTAWLASCAGGTASYVSSPVRTGTTSVRLVDTSSSAPCGAFQDVTQGIAASAPYTISAWVKVDSGVPSLRIEYRGSGGNEIGLAFIEAEPSSGFVHLQKTVTTPAGTASVTIRMYSPTASTGTSYWDDLGLAAGSAPAT